MLYTKVVEQLRFLDSFSYFFSGRIFCDQEKQRQIVYGFFFTDTSFFQTYSDSFLII